MEESNQKKRRIFALGESLLDLVYQNNSDFRAVPGGSMLNASVSLGRMDADVYLISEFGQDKAGQLIKSFLQENKVNTDHCSLNLGHKTSLALAFLDKEQKASYSFYHDTPENIDSENLPTFKKEDILLFGSFYAIKPNRHTHILKVLQANSTIEALVYYDLNIRKAQSSDMTRFYESYLQNISQSSVVKGSDEDFLQLFGTSEPDIIYSKTSPFCKVLIITNGHKPIHVFTPTFHKTYNVPSIIPISTIGAGDSFNAGFLYKVSLSSRTANDIHLINELEMDSFIEQGITFATETCLSSDNYIKGHSKPDFSESQD